ncbi:hypothetical protein QYE76_040907 [Lolium multiflorum]|uniref:Reverse transcriptase domain-containing protein n=1 Tax=Lolium multiflorum TaxID=4521 RepID=A0AAD8WTM1_LOLMU|nr:hypothetical protein QYE76_040907 [Lolium multiflorum]
MHTFIGGLQRGGLLQHKLTCMVNANKLPLDEMINIASDHTAADDDAGGDLAATAIPLHQQKKNRDNGVSNNNKRKNPSEDQKGGGSDMVAMTFQRGGPGGGRGRGRGGGAGRGQARGHRCRIPRPPNYVKWSEKACTFDRSDHPAVIPKECYALVVSPRIDGYDFSKCLMDGGASLNIMYLETLERMNLTKEQLKHSTTEFHGVVPGKTYCCAHHTFLLGFPTDVYIYAHHLGSIKLPVAFGDVNNYREEMITFEVVPFKSSYHVIFGRPTYHKFHARACYIYNKLKIPGPNGMITVSGDYKKARDCEEGEAAFAESVISGEELQGYRAAVDPTEMQTTKKQISEQKNSFKAAIETKKHDLIEGDSSKQIRMKKSDQKATSFITPFGTYCYVTMPFGLKNAGATYQRRMQRCLKDQIGRNVHAYVDDIVVMTRKGSDLISDLKETF